MPEEREAQDPEAADLPELVVPPGYRRDRRGHWRYEASGERVPGARDVTLTSLYGGVSPGSEYKEVPVDAALSSPELAWCLSIPNRHVGVVGVAAHRRRGRVTRVVIVPRDEWERRSQVPLGIVAPELMPDRLLDTERVARLVGVSRQTIATYLARDLIPPPVARVGHSPVWSLPIVEEWLAKRPGQGVGGGRRAAGGRGASRSKRRLQEVKRTRGARKGKELLDWADAVLDRYGVDDE